MTLRLALQLEQVDRELQAYEQVIESKARLSSLCPLRVSLELPVSLPWRSGPQPSSLQRRTTCNFFARRSAIAGRARLSQRKLCALQADAWVVVRVGDPQWVFNWRLQAEVEMRAAGKAGLSDAQARRRATPHHPLAAATINILSLPPWCHRRPGATASCAALRRRSGTLAYLLRSRCSGAALLALLDVGKPRKKNHNTRLQ